MAGKDYIMKITYYGHACFGVETNGHHLLFDPFIRPNELAKNIDVESIKADYILITHAHHDHLVDAEEIANRCKATLISNYEISMHYAAKGIKIRPINHGGQISLPFGHVKYVNAIHSSSFADGSYGGQPGGFVIWNDEICFYHAGDTALTMDMQLIPRTCPALDFSIFPIGDTFTMGYADAVIATELVACDKVVGCHYDTFAPIQLDKEAAKKAFASAGKTLVLPGIGESLSRI